MLSELGEKALFLKMNEFYDTLSDSQKLIFINQSTDACPRDRSKVNPFMFYKFFNNFLCFHGGPRVVNLKVKRSPNLVVNLPVFQNTKNVLVNGARSDKEIYTVLNSIGFRDQFKIKTEENINKRFKLDNNVRRILQNTANVKSPLIKIILFPVESHILYESESYKYAFSVISLVDESNGGHAVVVYKKAGNYHLFDSNFTYSTKLKDPYNFINEIITIQNKRYLKNKFVKGYYTCHVLFKEKSLEGVYPTCRREYQKIKGPITANVLDRPSRYTPAQVSFFKRTVASRKRRILSKSIPTATPGVYKSKRGVTFRINENLGTRKYIKNVSGLEQVGKTMTGRPIYKTPTGATFALSRGGHPNYYAKQKRNRVLTPYLDSKKRPIYKMPGRKHNFVLTEKGQYSFPKARYFANTGNKIKNYTNVPEHLRPYLKRHS